MRAAQRDWRHRPPVVRWAVVWAARWMVPESRGRGLGGGGGGLRRAEEEDALWKTIEIGFDRLWAVAGVQVSGLRVGGE